MKRREEKWRKTHASGRVKWAACQRNPSSIVAYLHSSEVIPRHLSLSFPSLYLTLTFYSSMCRFSLRSSCHVSTFIVLLHLFSRWYINHLLHFFSSHYCSLSFCSILSLFQYNSLHCSFDFWFINTNLVFSFRTNFPLICALSLFIFVFLFSLANVPRLHP